MYPSTTTGSVPGIEIVRKPPPAGAQIPGSVHMAVSEATIAASTTDPPAPAALPAASVTVIEGPATAIRGIKQD